MNLSDRIRFILEKSGLNQKKFADRIGVSDGFISKLLKGNCKISNTTAAVLEKEFGFSKAWVLEGKEPKTVEKKELNSVQKKIIYAVENVLTESELKAVYAYIEVQKQIKKEEKRNAN
ncbi:helix-turn-helix transcriptional regulator [Treponema pedis]|uniref:helix-turn-helix domain-containing protein n=1 Tax=Treponema pedis TaxID=409322 RepID=UPI0031341BDF